MGDCKKVYIFGYSGHAYVLVESMLELGYIILGYFDRQEAISNPYSLKYFGHELNVNLNSIINDNFVFPTVGDVNLREKMIKMFNSENLNQFVLIDNSAKVSKSAIIGVSTYVGKNSSVNALSKIGSGVIINTNSVVEHECEISDFVHIGPSATLAGNIKVGNKSFIGANSVIKERMSVGLNCILGAGSVLLHNLPNNQTWVGNPARKKGVKIKE